MCRSRGSSQREARRDRCRSPATAARTISPGASASSPAARNITPPVIFSDVRSAPSSSSRWRRGSRAGAATAARHAGRRAALACAPRSGDGTAADDERDEPSDIAIEVEGLTKSFGGRKVVDNLTLRVERGRIHGFLGPNGSGKTTTIRMLCGLLTPDSGEGRCLGYDIRTQQERDQAPRRLHDAALLALSRSHRSARIWNSSRASMVSSAARGGAGGAGTRLGLAGARRATRRRTLRRLEAAAGARRLHSARPRAAAARRADRRRRSEGAARLLG